MKIARIAKTFFQSLVDESGNSDQKSWLPDYQPQRDAITDSMLVGKKKKNSSKDWEESLKKVVTAAVTTDKQWLIPGFILYVVAHFIIVQWWAQIYIFPCEPF